MEAVVDVIRLAVANASFNTMVRLLRAGVP
jgi:hypothetical protein